MKDPTVIEIFGEHRGALESGEARILAVLIYYPERDEIVTVARDDNRADDVYKMMERFGMSANMHR